MTPNTLLLNSLTDASALVFPTRAVFGFEANVELIDSVQFVDPSIIPFRRWRGAGGGCQNQSFVLPLIDRVRGICGIVGIDHDKLFFVTVVCDPIMSGKIGVTLDEPCPMKMVIFSMMFLSSPIPAMIAIVAYFERG